VVHAKVPQDSIYIAFHGPARTDAGYYEMDLVSDLLSRGSSSRLYRRLVKETELFSEIDAYQTGSLDPNLFVVTGKPSPNVSLEAAEEAVWAELEQIGAVPIADYELDKVKNKVESTMVFAEMSILD